MMQMNPSQQELTGILSRTDPSGTGVLNGRLSFSMRIPVLLVSVLLKLFV